MHFKFSNRSLLIFLLIFIGEHSQAYLTSDISTSLGATSYSLKLTNSTQSLNSMSMLSFSYNVYYSPLKSALTLDFSEMAKSNVGSLSYVRLGAGLRWYVFGFNGDRFIFDSKVEGRVLRPAPFIGFSAGLVSISVPKFNSDSKQYFNAVAYNIDVRTGVEVPLSRDFFLITQLSIDKGLTSYNATTNQSFSYLGLGIYFGVKITSF